MNLTYSFILSFVSSSTASSKAKIQRIYATTANDLLDFLRNHVCKFSCHDTNSKRKHQNVM